MKMEIRQAIEHHNTLNNKLTQHSFFLNSDFELSIPVLISVLKYAKHGTDIMLSQQQYIPSIYDL